MAVNYGSLPFLEAIAFFRAKLNLPTKKWDDLLGAAHDRAFVVAGAMQADLLADLRAAVDKAIAEGTTIETFRKDFKQTVAQRGWTGWTGQGTKAGEAWRARVIYDTNLFTSYSAGRTKQMKEVAELRPYWRYRHSPASVEPRPEHVAWDGIILRHDDPWWATHTRPGGFSCKCYIETLAERDMKKQGLAVTDKDKIPFPNSGIDKGWDYQPGASVAADLARLEKMKADKLKRLGLPGDTMQSGPTGPILLGPKFIKPTTPPVSAKDYQDAGQLITSTLPSGTIQPEKCFDDLIKLLEQEIGISTPCQVQSKGDGANLVKEASKRYPDSWTKEADAFGPLYTKAKANTRGWAWTAPPGSMPNAKYRLPDFWAVPQEDNAGYIVIRKDVGNAVHEYAHRLQSALPALDKLFQDLHQSRTAGDPLKPLKNLVPGSSYKANEVTREDKYIDPYQGKEYAQGGALEVMTMAFESVIGLDKGHPSFTRRLENFKKMYRNDREMFDFVVGLLFHWKP